MVENRALLYAILLSLAARIGTPQLWNAIDC
jgi:hypothetical protein